MKYVTGCGGKYELSKMGPITASLVTHLLSHLSSSSLGPGPPPCASPGSAADCPPPPSEHLHPKCWWPRGTCPRTAGAMRAAVPEVLYWPAQPELSSVKERLPLWAREIVLQKALRLPWTHGLWKDPPNPQPSYDPHGGWHFLSHPMTDIDRNTSNRTRQRKHCRRSETNRERVENTHLSNHSSHTEMFASLYINVFRLISIPINVSVLSKIREEGLILVAHHMRKDIKAN